MASLWLQTLASRPPWIQFLACFGSLTTHYLCLCRFRVEVWTNQISHHDWPQIGVFFWACYFYRLLYETTCIHRVPHASLTPQCSCSLEDCSASPDVDHSRAVVCFQTCASRSIRRSSRSNFWTPALNSGLHRKLLGWPWGRRGARAPPPFWSASTCGGI